MKTNSRFEGSNMKSMIVCCAASFPIFVLDSSLSKSAFLTLMTDIDFGAYYVLPSKCIPYKK